MKSPAPKLDIPSLDDSSFRWIAIALIVLVEAMLYSPSFVHGLAGYDYVFRELHDRPLASLWNNPTDELGHWRPLAYSINHLLFSLFGETSYLWHLFNFLIHLISTLIFFALLRRLFEASEGKGVAVPLLGTLVFQVHPASVQNVYWASGFSDLLCMLFLLLATFFVVAGIQKPKTHLIVLAAIFFAAALLSKESAIVFPFYLALMIRLTLGSWKAVLELHGRLLALVSLLAIAFGIGFVLISGELFRQQSGLLAGAWGVFLRGFGMLVIPTDSMRILELVDMSVFAVVGLAGAMIAVVVLFIRRGILNVGLLILLAVVFFAGFAVYAVGGYISLRLMYGSIGFFTISVFLLLTRTTWWKGRDAVIQVLRWSVLLFAVLTFYSSITAVMDWHVADKFAKAMGDSFVMYHQDAQESRYVFGAVPSRLRQAEICGEPATDFRGILRKNEMSDSVALSSLLRIVLLDREDVSANVVLLKGSQNSLIVGTQTENQFFLFGRVDTPHALPIGTVFEDQGYRVEVLETILDDRAVTVKVTAKDPADLERLLFFDDQEKQFISLSDIEPMSEDEPNE